MVIQDESVKEYMIHWAINFDNEIKLDTWEYFWKKSMQISTCAVIKENSFKMMTKWYITPQKLAKIDKSISDRCWKCKHKGGTFYHL